MGRNVARPRMLNRAARTREDEVTQLRAGEMGEGILGEGEEMKAKRMYVRRVDPSCTLPSPGARTSKKPQEMGSRSSGSDRVGWS